MQPVRVAVLSDDRLLCEGLLRIIASEPSFAVVGQDDQPILAPSLRAARPHVLLVDSRMEGAFSLCAALKRDGEPVVILIAARDDDDWAVGALEAGTRGILAKSARPEELIKAVRVVHKGEIWARRHVLAARLEHLAGASVAGRAVDALLEQRLSSRERDVFRQAATGLSNKELASRLAISEATVKVHLTRIFRKLGVRGRAELAAAYHGMIPPAAEQASRPHLRRLA
jgi:DNA-binding NarL/FixJ family response regulator